MPDLQPQCWVLFRRPDELPGDALPGDWPGPYVARRFERNAKAEMVPTEDVVFADTYPGVADKLLDRTRFDSRKLVAKTMQATPEDHPTILGTVFIRSKANLSPMSSMSPVTIAKAEAWWDSIGRHVLRKEFNQETAAPRVSTGAGPTTIIPGEIVDTIPSGILKALPWAMLTRKEQVAVVLKWHDAKVPEQ